ncbi:MAG: class I SAM-dependent methyltransferase [Nitrospirota bacterium]
MNRAGAGQRERYDDEWNGWTAGATAFAGVRRYDQISSVVQQLSSRKILDVGCGDGRLARAIRANCPDVVIHGCDLPPWPSLEVKDSIGSTPLTSIARSCRSPMGASIW